MFRDIPISTMKYLKHIAYGKCHILQIKERV